MADYEHIKDHFSEARIFMRRLIVVVILIVCLLGVLLARFYNLQVVNYRDYVTRSDSNRVQVQPIPPTRGLIYDRNGVLLADNRPSYTLTLIKERVKNLQATLDILDEVISFKDEELEKFRTRMQQRRRPFEAVPLRYRLSQEEIARLAVNEYRLPGVEVKAELVRHYPLGVLTAHSVGYVGRINDRELGGFDEEQYRRYSGTHTIGKIGLEKYYEEKLLGDVGYQNVETNARGRVLRVLERTDPVPGANLTLHLDSLLQQVAYDAMGQRRGSVVALDVNSGGVLAMVSTPSYNPNLFVTGISFKDYRALNQSLDLPLFNRSIQGQYPPGSTIKPMLGLAGLHYNYIDANYSVKDPGFYQLEGEERLYRDWKRKGHGSRIKLKQAVAESCDTYYYDLAFRMGIDNIHNFGSHFGLGKRTGVDVPSERRGIWPSRDWKRRVRGLPWFPGDSLNVGIGQGDVLTTPMQLAVMTATLANQGQQLQPQLVSSVNDAGVSPVLADSVEAKEGHWRQIYDAMKAVVHSQRGTAQSIRYGLDYKIAGKTGTAQVVGIAQGEEYDSEALIERQRDHALFVAFAPAADPKIAIAVIVENGEKSSTAAKIARKVFDAYLQAEAVKASAAAVSTINHSLEPNGSIGRLMREDS